MADFGGEIETFRAEVREWLEASLHRAELSILRQGHGFIEQCQTLLKMSGRIRVTER